MPQTLQKNSPAELPAAAYARHSTDRQCRTEIQLYKIARHCEENGFSLSPGHIYVDEGETGTNTDRADFQRMVAAATRGEFSCVVIYDVTRGSRDVADWFNFRKEMRRWGIRVVSTMEQLGDISNPNDF